MLDDQKKYWFESGLRNWESAKLMAEHGHRDWSLFVGQLAVEKLLKGLVMIKTNITPPLIHNLVRLAQLAEIDLTADQAKELAKITTFNVEARYSEIKSELYKLATPEFTMEWIAVMERYVIWFKSLY